MEAREYTNKLLEAVEAGLINKNELLYNCLNYMSEDDVRALCIDYEYDELFDEPLEEDEDEEEGCDL